ncbi:MAG: hypothetical protein ACLPND_00205, partial [Candidatus Korobacteraceae bacterium]
PADFLMLSRTLEISFGQLSRPYLPFLWRFAVTGAVALAVRNWLGAPDLLHLVLSASIVGLVYLLLVLPYVWTTPLRGYIQDAAATLTSTMRARVLGWSNNGRIHNPEVRIQNTTGASPAPSF